MLLEHPAHGPVTTDELRADIAAFKAKRAHYNDLGFTAETVQMLLDKIDELSSVNTGTSLD